jgi:hypothetical protein
MTGIRKLKFMLPTQEGRTLSAGTEVATTDQSVTGWHKVRFLVVLVGEARCHVREEDLAYAWGGQ